MDQFNRNYPRGMPDSQSSKSSLYSTESAGNRRSYIEARNSTDTTRTTTSSRPVSYMSAAIPRRKPAPIVTTPLPATSTPSRRTPSVDIPSAQSQLPPQTIPRASKGLLLLVVAAEPAPNTISHVRVLFKRHSFSGVTIIGNRAYEAKLKNLRMDLYSLIGRMSMELGVQTYLRDSWSEADTAAVLHDAVGTVDEKLRAVLCVPGTEELVKSDILHLSEAQVATTWYQSFGFIHTVARATFPLILLDGHSKKVASGFFVTQTIDQGAATMVMRSACGLLLRQLAESYRTKGLAVGYAEEHLIPEPEPEPEPVNGHGNGGLKAVETDDMVDDESAFIAAESPTQLWGMWALQEQLGEA